MSFSNHTSITLLDNTDYPILYQDWVIGNTRHEYISEEYELLLNAINSRILHVVDDVTALHFVNESLTYMTIEEIIQCYLHIPNKQQKKRNQDSKKDISPKLIGGAIDKDRLGPEIQGDDVYIYKFMMLMDTVHDFKEVVYRGRKPILHLGENINDYLKKYSNWIPKDFTHELMMNEEECIRELAKYKFLKFKIENIDDEYIDITNPFYSININQYNIHNSPTISYKDLLINNISNSLVNSLINKVFSVEVFTSTVSVPNRKDIFRLEDTQLYSLLGYINELTYNNYKEFQLDNIDNIFNKLMLSLSYINNTIKVIIDLKEDTKKFIFKNQVSLDNLPRWSVNYSDANIFDPIKGEGLINNNIEHRPTMCIYDARLVPYQVFLDGVKEELPNNKQKQHGHHYKYTNTTIMDLSYNETYETNDIISNTFSIKSINNIIKNKKRNIEVKEPNDLEDKLLSFNIDTLFALKRAGDWGQVEHSKRYGKIFITGDRYAALYAYFRKVPTILYRNKLVVDESRLVITENHRFPNLVQYSFIIMNPNYLIE